MDIKHETYRLAITRIMGSGPEWWTHSRIVDRIFKDGIPDDTKEGILDAMIALTKEGRIEERISGDGFSFYRLARHVD